MALDATQDIRPGNTLLLWWCLAGSAAAHLLLLTLVQGGRAPKDMPPIPLMVELREPPPKLVPPTPLPMATRPTPPAHPKAQPREVRPAEPPRTAAILTASPEVPPAPAAIVVPEQKPAPPPDVLRPQPAAPAPTAVAVTPPRSDAAYLNNPRPAYPMAARRRGDQGTVLIRVWVTLEGVAASVGLEKTSGHPSLDEAALTAVKSWRFVPARQAGQPVEAPYVVPIVFKVE